MVIVYVPCSWGFSGARIQMAEIYCLFQWGVNPSYCMWDLSCGPILHVWHARVSLNAWKIGDKLIPSWKKKETLEWVYINNHSPDN